MVCRCQGAAQAPQRARRSCRYRAAVSHRTAAPAPRSGNHRQRPRDHQPPRCHRSGGLRPWLRRQFEPTRPAGGRRAPRPAGHRPALQPSLRGGCGRRAPASDRARRGARGWKRPDDQSSPAAFPALRAENRGLGFRPQHPAPAAPSSRSVPAGSLHPRPQRPKCARTPSPTSHDGTGSGRWRGR